MAAILVFAISWVVLLSRFGFLAMVVAVALQSLGGKSPGSMDPGTWFVGYAVGNCVLLLVLGAYGLYCSVGSQALVRDDLLER